MSGDWQTGALESSACIFGWQPVRGGANGGDDAGRGGLIHLCALNFSGILKPEVFPIGLLTGTQWGHRSSMGPVNRSLSNTSIRVLFTKRLESFRNSERLNADMQLYKRSFANRIGNRLAKPLSWVACSPLLYKSTRMVDAYLNFLIGKGSGTGRDIGEEVRAAVARIHRLQPMVFDVGANVGNWSAGLLQVIPSAKIYMFDPSQGCQAAIRQKNLVTVQVW